MVSPGDHTQMTGIILKTCNMLRLHMCKVLGHEVLASLALRGCPPCMCTAVPAGWLSKDVERSICSDQICLLWHAMCHLNLLSSSVWRASIIVRPC